MSDCCGCAELPAENGRDNRQRERRLLIGCKRQPAESDGRRTLRLCKGRTAAREHGLQKYNRKNRDQIEIRTAYSTSDISWLYEKEKWKALKCIGAIKTEFEKDERMALLYLQPRTFSGRTASSCPDGVGSRNDALVIGYSLW